MPRTHPSQLRWRNRFLISSRMSSSVSALGYCFFGFGAGGGKNSGFRLCVLRRGGVAFLRRQGAKLLLVMTLPVLLLLFELLLVGEFGFGLPRNRHQMPGIAARAPRDHFIKPFPEGALIAVLAAINQLLKSEQGPAN